MGRCCCGWRGAGVGWRPGPSWAQARMARASRSCPRGRRSASRGKHRARRPRRSPTAVAAGDAKHICDRTGVKDLDHAPCEHGHTIGRTSVLALRARFRRADTARFAHSVHRERGTRAPLGRRLPAGSRRSPLAEGGGHGGLAVSSVSSVIDRKDPPDRGESPACVDHPRLRTRCRSPACRGSWRASRAWCAARTSRWRWRRGCGSSTPRRCPPGSTCR